MSPVSDASRRRPESAALFPNIPRDLSWSREKTEQGLLKDAQRFSGLQVTRIYGRFSKDNGKRGRWEEGWQDACWVSECRECRRGGTSSQPRLSLRRLLCPSYFTRVSGKWISKEILHIYLQLGNRPDSLMSQGLSLSTQQLRPATFHRFLHNLHKNIIWNNFFLVLSMSDQNHPAP